MKTLNKTDLRIIKRDLDDNLRQIEGIDARVLGSFPRLKKNKDFLKAQLERAKIILEKGGDGKS